MEFMLSFLKKNKRTNEQTKTRKKKTTKLKKEKKMGNKSWRRVVFRSG